jgi:hypothetical protein
MSVPKKGSLSSGAFPTRSTPHLIVPAILSHVTPPITEQLGGIRNLILEYINQYGNLNGVHKFMVEHPQLSRDLLKLYEDTHILEVNGRRRTLIGIHTDEEWCNKKIEYKHRCVYCNKESDRLTKDHIIPVLYGGSNTIDNIVPACKSCNSKKHTRLLSELVGMFPEKII